MFKIQPALKMTKLRYSVLEILIPGCHAWLLVEVYCFEINDLSFVSFKASYSWFSRMINKKRNIRVGEVTQWLRVFALLPHDSISDPSTHIWQLETSYCSSSRGSDASNVTGTHMLLPTYRHTLK